MTLFVYINVIVYDQRQTKGQKWLGERGGKGEQGTNLLGSRNSDRWGEDEEKGSD